MRGFWSVISGAMAILSLIALLMGEPAEAMQIIQLGMLFLIASEVSESK